MLAVATARGLIPGSDADPPLKFPSNNILAGDKVLYKCHPVAEVVAKNVHGAEAALKLAQVRYEPFPSVTDVRPAMADDAPIFTLTSLTVA